jgi:uncharacterized RDD family membrane protein YckC
VSAADHGGAASNTPPPAVPDATLARRFASLVYEAMILCALLLLAGFVTLPLVPSTGASALRIPDAPARALSLAIVFGASAVYCVVSWSNGRRTLPMKTWHIALVSRDGGSVDRRVAFTRYLSGWIGPVLALAGYLALRPLGAGVWALPLVALNFLWALVDRDRQFLHDRIAGTRLVRR